MVITNLKEIFNRLWFAFILIIILPLAILENIVVSFYDSFEYLTKHLKHNLQIMWRKYCNYWKEVVE